MDGQRFDAITRKLATRTSRRSVTKGVAGGTIGAGLAMAGLSRGTARSANQGTVCYTTSSSALIDQLITVLIQVLASFGIPLPANVGPSHGEVVDCQGSTVLNPETCECDCALTESDCPGGVNLETCECMPVICAAENAGCDDQDTDCTCLFQVVGGNKTSELVCVDHAGANGHDCSANADCPMDGMICAWDDDCGEPFCYPPCGDAESFAMLPDKLA